MTHLSAVREDLRFTPLDEAGLRSWCRPARFDWLDRLGTLPIADTELLNLSHHCPIAIQTLPTGPSVVCVVDSELLRVSRVNRHGRWTAPYAPLALRSLPFRMREERGDIGIEVALDLARVGDVNEPALSFQGEDSTPSPEFAHVLTMLERLRQGAARLTDAAKLLVAADVLVPVAASGRNVAGPVLEVVSGERLGALSDRRAAALTADDCLALDLAAASLFSQHWLAAEFLTERPAGTRGGMTAARGEGGPPHPLTEAIGGPVCMDDSPLFSIDDYVASRALPHD